MHPDFDSLPVFPNLKAMFAMAAVAPPHGRRSQRSGSAPLHCVAHRDQRLTTDGGQSWREVALPEGAGTAVAAACGCGGWLGCRVEVHSIGARCYITRHVQEMTDRRRNSWPHRDLGMAGISASFPYCVFQRRTVRSLIPLRTLRAVDGAGNLCPKPTVSVPWAT